MRCSERKSSTLVLKGLTRLWKLNRMESDQCSDPRAGTRLLAVLPKGGRRTTSMYQWPFPKSCRSWQVCDRRAYMQSAPRWPATTHGNRLLRRPSQLSLPTSAREKTDVEASDVEDPNFQKVPTSNCALQFVGGGANYKKKTWDTFLWFFWNWTLVVHQSASHPYSIIRELMNFSKIWLRYAWDIPKICLRYSWDMLR